MLAYIPYMDPMGYQMTCYDYSLLLCLVSRNVLFGYPASPEGALCILLLPVLLNCMHI